MRLEISKIRSAEEPGPVERSAARRIQHTCERIRMDTAGLIHERSLQEIAENTFTSSERRLGAELLQHQLLDRVVKNSVSRADTRPARSARQFGKPSVAHTWTPIQS